MSKWQSCSRFLLSCYARNSITSECQFSCYPAFVFLLHICTLDQQYFTPPCWKERWNGGKKNQKPKRKLVEISFLWLWRQNNCTGLEWKEAGHMSLFSHGHPGFRTNFNWSSSQICVMMKHYECLMLLWKHSSAVVSTAEKITQTNTRE